MTVLERLQRIADLHVETLPIALVCQKIEGRQLWGRTTKVKRSLLFHSICVPRRAHALRSGPDPRIEASMENRSEEHTSELQSLMRISYAVFCLKQKNHTQDITKRT